MAMAGRSPDVSIGVRYISNQPGLFFGGHQGFVPLILLPKE